MPKAPSTIGASARFSLAVALLWLSYQGQILGNTAPYERLSRYLQRQEWRQADQETYELMLRIAGPKSAQQGRFDRQEWQTFSCEALRTIDQLWSNASSGQLGFRAQKRLFEQEQRRVVAYYQRIQWLTDNLEWRVAWQYNAAEKRSTYLPGKEPQFTQPPEGHLPARLEWVEYGERRFQRVYACGL